MRTFVTRGNLHGSDPPVNILPPLWHVSATSQIVAGSIFGVAFVVAVVYMVRVAIHTRTRYPLFMILGGALCVFVEPFVDVLGHCMFPTVDMPIWLNAFGRGIPLDMAPVYTVYFGAACPLHHAADGPAAGHHGGSGGRCAQPPW